MSTFWKEQTIWRREREFKVLRTLNREDVQLEAITTGEISTHKACDLLAEYVEGTLLTTTERRRSLNLASPHRKPARMDAMTAAARLETHRRIDYLVRLERKGSFLKAKADLLLDISEISVARNEPRPPHMTTIYRWRRSFLNAKSDVRALFCTFNKRGGRGLGRLAPEVEAILDEKIETVFLASKKSSGADVLNAVVLEIQLRNAQRSERDALKAPSKATIGRRLRKLYAFDLAVARYGRREAERRFALHRGARKVSRILELVEIDHTPVDLMVCDDNRVPIGRPTLTVVLDRYSRCVLGFHLSLAGHGVSAVFAALRHALLPKTYLKDRYVDLDLTWPPMGWPELVLMDNGAEFHADAVRDALANINVISEFAGSRNPNDKPHVERFLRTFNYEYIHKLPGTTLAKVHQRIGFKAEEDACVTLEELDRMTHVWICQVYHLHPHRGLSGRTPLSVWEESAAEFPPQLKFNREDLDIEFSQLAQSSLQHYGIDLNTFVYVSPRLLTMRRLLPMNSKVTVKWPEHEAGVIYVWDADAEEYFAVPNKQAEYSGLTVEQAKLAKKTKASGDPSYRQVNASGQAIVRAMVSDAMADKKLKNRRKGARLGNRTSEKAREGIPSTEPMAINLSSSDTTPVACITHKAVEVEVEGGVL